MSTDLTEVKKEISDLEALRKQNKVISEAYKSFQDCIFMLDCSASMDGMLSDGKSKMEHLRDALTRLRVNEKNCVSFSSQVAPGIDTVSHSGTNMEELFKYVKQHYKYKKAVLISDGEPNDMYTGGGGQASINAAKELKVGIGIIYIGEAGSIGERFMERLAVETGGQSVTVLQGTSTLLTEKIVGLLK